MSSPLPFYLKSQKFVHNSKLLLGGESRITQDDQFESQNPSKGDGFQSKTDIPKPQSLDLTNWKTSRTRQLSSNSNSKRKKPVMRNNSPITKSFKLMSKMNVQYIPATKAIMQILDRPKSVKFHNRHRSKQSDYKREGGDEVREDSESKTERSVIKPFNRWALLKEKGKAEGNHNEEEKELLEEINTLRGQQTMKRKLFLTVRTRGSESHSAVPNKSAIEETTQKLKTAEKELVKLAKLESRMEESKEFSRKRQKNKSFVGRTFVLNQKSRLQNEFTKNVFEELGETNDINVIKTFYKKLYSNNEKNYQDKASATLGTHNLYKLVPKKKKKRAYIQTKTQAEIKSLQEKREVSKYLAESPTRIRNYIENQKTQLEIEAKGRSSKKKEKIPIKSISSLANELLIKKTEDKYREYFLSCQPSANTSMDVRDTHKEMNKIKAMVGSIKTVSNDIGYQQNETLSKIDELMELGQTSKKYNHILRKAANIIYSKDHDSAINMIDSNAATFINARDSFGKNVLHYASHCRDGTLVRKLFEKYRPLRHKRDVFDRTPIEIVEKIHGGFVQVASPSKMISSGNFLL